MCARWPMIWAKCWVAARICRLAPNRRGPFESNRRIRWKSLSEHGWTQRDACLLPADILAEACPLPLDLEAAWQICHGQPVWLPRLKVGEAFRLYAPDGRFLGVAEVNQDGKVAPRRLVVT
jgi:tRNA pseudouridine55 synthase